MMGMTLRERRMQSEWLLLTRLAEANPTILRTINRTPDAFHVHLSETPGWVADETGPIALQEHWVDYVFPRYYPTLPLEAYCRRAPFHPNAHPGTGFLCLWTDYTPNRSILDAVVTTRAVLAHQAVNRDMRHCMQPSAFHSERLPLSALNVPEDCRAGMSVPLNQRRLRLTPVQDDQVHPQSSLAISHS
ncbi:ubiquitin-conjugating enzyme E2 variant [Granulicella mallensis]|uniref:UBC core domain-containing protein n=1 Tax=Granulicella mallensis (strain ATCC BAA-1857 / DSM 23137 / MP5ACTX8) TaxID=682795 RepID=G8NS65_GRAMM|nr:hypothetical protein [Granulicella mallensis]AEU36273.1 hypothetical protein AciX8_1942 [Granulicella mallensis MP5ACTX8]